MDADISLEHGSGLLYHPLHPLRHEIRLLKFTHNQTNIDSPIGSTQIPELNIYNAFLEDNPEYIALSYTWGDPHKTVTVRVNNNIVLVTKNLYSALVHLADDIGSQSIWIDALYIN